MAKLAGSTLLTKSGTTLGTVAYKSPEQTKGDPVDCRTDIWSLGVTLYEMLTGRLPFQADYDQAVVYRIINEVPESVRSFRKDVSTELESVIRKSLAKDPRERYQRMDELLSDVWKARGETKKSALSWPKEVKQKALFVGAGGAREFSSCQTNE